MPSGSDNNQESSPRKLVRRRRTAEESRSRIVAEAAREFGRRGFEAARIEDIATALDLSPAAVLYHFDSKLDLYRVVLDGLFGDSVQRMQEAIDESETTQERLRSMIDSMIDHVVEFPETAQISLRNATVDDELLRSDASLRAIPYMDALRQLVEGAHPDGTDPDALSVMVGSALFGTAMLYIVAAPRYGGPAAAAHLSPTKVAALKETLLAIGMRLLVGDTAPPQDR